MRLAGLLHDVGKVGVPDAILQQGRAATDEERAVIARHPELGAQILEHPSLADVQAWVAAHHERPDGTGYPHGLAGDALPLEARIVAVADAYEAMTSDRSYRDAIGHARARARAARHAGTQFDARRRGGVPRRARPRGRARRGAARRRRAALTGRRCLS